MGRGGWRASAIVAAGALAAASAPALPVSPPTIADQRRALAGAKAAAAAAARHADAIAAAAAGEQDAARRARGEERAAAARVVRAEADLATGRVRVTLIGRLLEAQRARLLAEERPVARLLGGLASLARRPALVGLAQPGTVDDLVHLRAVLGSAVPAIRARTTSLRAQLAATRALEADAALAATALARARASVEGERAALAALEARHSGQAVLLGRSALAESDRAIALGERARDLVDAIADTGNGQATRAELETLPGPPLPMSVPVPPGGSMRPTSAYRMPAAGRLVTGFGELSAEGVRSRGLTIAVSPGSRVVAPAAGRIAYAGRFRGYGGVMILDHGAGWTTLLTGLARTPLRRGASVTAGAAIGTVAAGEAPRVTVELRRRGRPIDLTALL